jgi:hypothetical protein
LLARSEGVFELALGAEEEIDFVSARLHFLSHVPAQD